MTSALKRLQRTGGEGQGEGRGGGLGRHSWAVTVTVPGVVFAEEGRGILQWKVNGVRL